ncbi:hypothetical protein Acsp03_23070 [Actinomadura sp. NBRC 104412]|uniref:MFS transporter n=1 Tax=Actinomadura sp. NBRC 104412 TaxID=3032203 RepID=UPI00249F9D19|nr:MFS transporter [Actinomadura sp. NBRC 104412]GLZ04841.1 hypothetical protein Acsp03_23070 [Actinomadura sp. NBRC 104412]
MGYLRLLRRPRILLLWAAQTLSVLGDRMYALVVMWLVWETTGSAALMGLVAVVESVPYIAAGMIGHRLLGRFSTLGRLAALDAARMLVVAALPVVWAVHGASLAALLVVAALLGVLGALFDPNLGALVPDLVRADEVQAVTGLMDLVGRIARIAGPGAAGLLLLALPEITLYVVDAVTFGVSAAVLTLLARRQTKTPATATGRREPIVMAPALGRPRAWRLVSAYPVTACMVALHGAGQMLLGVALVLPALLALRGGDSSTLYAAVSTATGAGAVLTNMVVGNVRAAMVFPGAYCVAWIVHGVVMAATGVVGSAGWIVALSLLAGAVGPFLAVGLRTHLAEFERSERLAWMTLDQTVLRAAGTAGTLVLPMLAAPLPATGFVVGGVATVAVAALAWAAAGVLRSRAVSRAGGGALVAEHAGGPSPR